MSLNLKYYKIKFVKTFLIKTNQTRLNLLNDLAVNATDPILYKRRLRMLEHLSSYESQILEKIRSFDTDDLKDIAIAQKNVFEGIEMILNRGA